MTSHRRIDHGRRHAVGSLWALAAAAGGASLAGCSADAPAPSVDWTLLDGSREALASLQGKVVLVQFWATTCSICLGEMPELVALERSLAPRGLVVRAVAMQDDPPARVSDYATRQKLPFGVVIDNTGAVARDFGHVVATPTWVLVDRAGRIAARAVGAADFVALRRRIETLLA